jgi:hypothetical protein
MSREALLLDQALDAVNQRLAASLPAPARIRESRSGLARLVTRARERGVDFQGEYERIRAEATLPPPASSPAPPAPPPVEAAPPTHPPARAPDPPDASAVPPASAQDSGVETTRLFLQFLEKREKHLFELMRTVVTEDRPPASAEAPASPRIEEQIDRLGKAVGDLTRVLDAHQPRFPRSVP